MLVEDLDAEDGAVMGVGEVVGVTSNFLHPQDYDSNICYRECSWRILMTRTMLYWASEKSSE